MEELSLEARLRRELELRLEWIAEAEEDYLKHFKEWQAEVAAADLDVVATSRRPDRLGRLLGRGQMIQDRLRRLEALRAGRDAFNSLLRVQGGTTEVVRNSGE